MVYFLLKEFFKPFLVDDIRLVRLVLTLRYSRYTENRKVFLLGYKVGLF